MILLEIAVRVFLYYYNLKRKFLVCYKKNHRVKICYSNIPERYLIRIFCLIILLSLAIISFIGFFLWFHFHLLGSWWSKLSRIRSAQRKLRNKDPDFLWIVRWILTFRKRVFHKLSTIQECQYCQLRFSCAMRRELVPWSPQPWNVILLYSVISNFKISSIICCKCRRK